MAVMTARSPNHKITPVLSLSDGSINLETWQNIIVDWDFTLSHRFYRSKKRLVNRLIRCNYSNEIWHFTKCFLCQYWYIIDEFKYIWQSCKAKIVFVLIASLFLHINEVFFFCLVTSLDIPEEMTIIYSMLIMELNQKGFEMITYADSV
jgi:hypothetical protein